MYNAKLQINKFTQPFHGYYTRQSGLAGTTEKLRILLEISFSARMPLLMAASAFGLDKRCHLTTPSTNNQNGMWTKSVS